MKKMLAVGGLALLAAYSQVDRSGADTANNLGVTINVVDIRPGRADVRIFNASSERLASVFAHCTFRESTGARIDSVPVLAHDITPGDVAKEVAYVTGSVKASRVECRIERVRKRIASTR